jgi:hypothetical protein
MLRHHNPSHSAWDQQPVDHATVVPVWPLWLLHESDRSLNQVVLLATHHRRKSDPSSSQLACPWSSIWLCCSEHIPRLPAHWLMLASPRVEASIKSTQHQDTSLAKPPLLLPCTKIGNTFSYFFNGRVGRLWCRDWASYLRFVGQLMPLCFDVDVVPDCVVCPLFNPLWVDGSLN